MVKNMLAYLGDCSSWFLESISRGDIDHALPITTYGGARRAANSFADAQYFSAQRNVRGWAWPLADLTHDYTKAPMAVVSAFLDPLLAAAVTKYNPPPPPGKTQEKEVGEDEKVLKDEILNILIAGRDTTAATLAFAGYLLARHPPTTGWNRAGCRCAWRRSLSRDGRDSKWLVLHIHLSANLLASFTMLFLCYISDELTLFYALMSVRLAKFPPFLGIEYDVCSKLFGTLNRWNQSLFQPSVS